MESSALGDAWEKQQYINISDLYDTEYVERLVPTFLVKSIHELIDEYLRERGYIDV